MLTSYTAMAGSGADLDTIHNYYENIVLNEIKRQIGDQTTDTDFLADVACVALNHLPPRYVRHDVDMAFYLSPKESIEMEEKVATAVRDAIAFVEQRGSRDTPA